MGKIHVLPERVANQIAAGEVEAVCGREEPAERSEGLATGIRSPHRAWFVRWGKEPAAEILSERSEPKDLSQTNLR
jgi:hypothetical protein